MSDAPGRGLSPLDAPVTPLRDCLTAILHGAVRVTPDTVDGVTKDEALDYAITLAWRVEAVMQHISDTGCTCPGDDYHASLPDHELGCLAQIEHLLTTFEKEQP